MSDYNIHIHLPDDGTTKETHVQETSNNLGKWFDGFLEKVKYCYDWKSLYALGEEFNRIGLTLHDTSGGRKVLCKVESGTPIVDNIVDDYIFVGSNESLDEEVSQRAMEVILYFLENNATSPQTVIDSSQTYTKDTALYGLPLKIYAESTQIRNQEVEIMGRIINE